MISTPKNYEKVITTISESKNNNFDDTKLLSLPKINTEIKD